MKLLGFYLLSALAAVGVIVWRQARRCERRLVLRHVKKHLAWAVLALVLVYLLFLFNSMFTVKVF
ncbi:hypothetical protein WKR98_23140 [Pigmentiphaga sp. YJ18]|uniref:hypothetical protein n=1 Tax=Pigmentiphaga sp. YJ18 TaxID=3134907 RepID=UPI003118DE45